MEAADHHGDELEDRAQVFPWWTASLLRQTDSLSGGQ